LCSCSFAAHVRLVPSNASSGCTRLHLRIARRTGQSISKPEQRSAACAGATYLWQ
jgi:hypothetical protein